MNSSLTCKTSWVNDVKRFRQVPPQRAFYLCSMMGPVTPCSITTCFYNLQSYNLPFECDLCDVFHLRRRRIGCSLQPWKGGADVGQSKERSVEFPCFFDVVQGYQGGIFGGFLNGMYPNSWMVSKYLGLIHLIRDSWQRINRSTQIERQETDLVLLRIRPA